MLFTHENINTIEKVIKIDLLSTNSFQLDLILISYKTYLITANHYTVKENTISSLELGIFTENDDDPSDGNNYMDEDDSSNEKQNYDHQVAQNTMHREAYE